MFTREEKELICWGLNARKNMVETGTPHLSAHDVESMGTAAPKDAKIKALDSIQMRFILTLEDLIKKVMHA